MRDKITILRASGRHCLGVQRRLGLGLASTRGCILDISSKRPRALQPLSTLFRLCNSSERASASATHRRLAVRLRPRAIAKSLAAAIKAMSHGALVVFHRLQNRSLRASRRFSHIPRYRRSCLRSANTSRTSPLRLLSTARISPPRNVTARPRENQPLPKEIYTIIGSANYRARGMLANNQFVRKRRTPRIPSRFAVNLRPR